MLFPIDMNLNNQYDNKINKDVLINLILLVIMRSIYLAFLLIVASLCKWEVNHEITGQASKDLSSGIRAQMLNNIYLIRNQTTKQALIKDLNEPDDSKRGLKQIDDPSVADIFQIFNLTNPNCDKNNDGVVSGEELKCLGKIWKNFVPNG